VADFYASTLSVAPELLGTKSAQSLENLFLNTNFLDLLEGVGKQDPKKLESLFQLIETRGIHTGEIDALLNAYVSEFINNGQLHIRRFPTPGNIAAGVDSAELAQFIEKNNDRITHILSTKGFLRGTDEKYSEFADFLRTRFRKSSAITPVTNVADLQGLSNEMFNYLSTTDEGRQKMTVAISASEATDLGIEVEGTVPGSNVGSVFYGKTQAFDGDRNYLFKDYRSGTIQSLKGKTSDVGKLIEQKMKDARVAATETVQVRAKDGTILGTVRNVNKRANDIVDIGVRNISHTEFNEMFANISALNSQITTQVPPVNAGLLEVGATITDRFYGISLEEAEKTDSTLASIAKRNLLFDKVRSGDELTAEQVKNLQKPGLLNTAVNVGLQRGEAYMAEVRAAGLPYGALDSRSRLMGVAKSRATGSFIGKKLLHSEGVRFGNEETARSVDINKIGTALKRPDAAQLGDLADISPLTYTIGQGSESVFGIQYQTKKKIAANYRTNDYVLNSYIRMTAGEAGGAVSSEKITMLANDMRELQLLDDNGKLMKFGSEEFYASSMNDFFESYVHAGASEARMPATINMVFSPRNLNQTQYEHLANQVIGLQMQTYQKLSHPSSYVTPTMKQDFNAVTQRIFGMNYNELRDKGIIDKIFTKDTLLDQKEVVSRIQGLDSEIPNAAKAAENYRAFVTSTAKEIETDGIIGFSIKDKTPFLKRIEQGENPVTDIREIERSTGVESNPTDTFSRNKRARLVATIEKDIDISDPALGIAEGTKQNQVLGGIFSPTADIEMEAAARKTASGNIGLNLTDAEIAAARRAEDLKALKNLQEIHTAPTKVRTVQTAQQLVASGRAQRATGGISIADNTAMAGQQFFRANKGKIYLAGLAVAAAVVGSQVAKKRNENDVYDATMHGMPVESGERPYGIQDALFAQKMGSRRKDPLVTAGVVGNLDRNKINHTSMGPDKNNHLFGG